MANTIKNIKTRQVAVLAANGVVDKEVSALRKALEAGGASLKIISPALGDITSADGKKIPVDMSLLTATSVVFDAVFVPGGSKSVTSLLEEPDAIHFINETYKHCKPIGANGEGVNLVKASYVSNKKDAGIVINQSTAAFIKALTDGRFWEREKKKTVPA